MSELTPEQEDELRCLAVADTVSLHMRQRLLAVLAELDRLRQRVADLTAGLNNLMVSGVIGGDDDAFDKAYDAAARLLAEDRP